MRRFMLIAATALAIFTIAARPSSAQDGRWEVRVRAVYLDPENHSDAYLPLGIPADAIRINGKWIPDLDVEYFFTPHWSGELLLTYPQSQTVTLQHSVLGGPTVLGSFKHLPPTLLLKYDFLPEDAFQPYVGLGVNLTFISDVHLTVPTVGSLQLDSTNVGPAAQAGFDYRLAPHWYFNMDLKWTMIRSDVKYRGVKISAVQLDPLLFGVGIGYRFGGETS